MSRSDAVKVFEPNVAAVVVTYNRKHLLCECLDGLLAQTSPLAKIFVIDNASTDGTAELLAERGYLQGEVCQYVRLSTNSGGAGGFHEGVRQAYEAGFEWLWLMDDDVEPTLSALQRMLAHASVSQCIQGSKVFSDGQSEDWERWADFDHSGRRIPSQSPQQEDYINAQTGCFEGMLIHREIISRIGFPDKRFFIGGDDVAYGYMASKHTQVIFLREKCFLKKINKLGYPGLLQRMRDRFLHRRSARFYFLSVRNEILLYGYIRDKVRAGRFTLRIGQMLLMHSMTTLLFERSAVNCQALWRGAMQGYRLLKSPRLEFDPETLRSMA